MWIQGILIDSSNLLWIQKFILAIDVLCFLCWPAVSNFPKSDVLVKIYLLSSEWFKVSFQSSFRKQTTQYQHREHEYSRARGRQYKGEGRKETKWCHTTWSGTMNCRHTHICAHAWTCFIWFLRKLKLWEIHEC